MKYCLYLVEAYNFVSSYREEVLQINIAPTLSVLWGIPIPADNLGGIILPLLNMLSTPQRLFGLYYNAEQVATNFLQNGGTESHG